MNGQSEITAAECSEAPSIQDATIASTTTARDDSTTGNLGPVPGPTNLGTNHANQVQGSLGAVPVVPATVTEGERKLQTLQLYRVQHKAPAYHDSLATLGPLPLSVSNAADLLLEDIRFPEEIQKHTKLTYRGRSQVSLIIHQAPDLHSLSCLLSTHCVISCTSSIALY